MRQKGWQISLNKGSHHDFVEPLSFACFGSGASGALPGGSVIEWERQHRGELHFKFEGRPEGRGGLALPGGF